MGDHTETVQVEFAPEVIGYRQLLEAFWSGHDPTKPRSKQYRSLILFHNQEQKRLALESREREQSRIGSLTTEIAAYSGFTPAEEYHQKYWLRQMPRLMNELMSMFPSEEDLITSTAAARLNGLLNGYGSIDEVRKILRALPSGSSKILDSLIRASSY